MVSGELNNIRERAVITLTRLPLCSIDTLPTESLAKEYDS